MALAGPIVFGNWKMNGLEADGLALAAAVHDGCQGMTGTLGVFPPATIVREIARQLAGSNVIVGGQDCHERVHGAFTGSISAAMLADAGATAVILGHSERRQGFGEDDALIAAKVRAASAAGLLCVVCIGETEAEWQAGQRADVLARQIDGSLPPEIAAQRLIVAYEPVWAIGTGRTPSSAEIEETHATVRERLSSRLDGGGTIPILYGGSVKRSNAEAVLRLQNVDGALVGGASLDAGDFLRIARAGAAG